MATIEKIGMNDNFIRFTCPINLWNLQALNDINEISGANGRISQEGKNFVVIYHWAHFSENQLGEFERIVRGADFTARCGRGVFSLGIL